MTRQSLVSILATTTEKGVPKISGFRSPVASRDGEVGERARLKGKRRRKRLKRSISANKVESSQSGNERLAGATRNRTEHESGGSNDSGISGLPVPSDQPKEVAGSENSTLHVDSGQASPLIGDDGMGGLRVSTAGKGQDASAVGQPREARYYGYGGYRGYGPYSPYGGYGAYGGGGMGGAYSGGYGGDMVGAFRDDKTTPRF